jgi:gamma-glutamyltranspeptidase
MLALGGNAIDATIAAAAALCVVYPNNVALGGDLVALVRDPAGTVRFVNATGRAPSAGLASTLRERHGAALPARGIDTVTVPGGVRGWSALDALGGRLTWAQRLAPAGALARGGHPVARSLARGILAERAVLESDPGCSAIFLPGGRPLGEGEDLRQPALADTLQLLIDGGPDAFYTGDLAERWVRALQERGSCISVEDARSFQPELADPIRATAFGVDVITSPPNTQGFSLLRALIALERNRIADPLGAGAAHLAELFAASNRVRAGWLADPAVGITAQQLLAMEPPALVAQAAGAARGDTVGLVAVSDDGWAVSLVQSVYWAFGAAVLDPGTGVLFQNRGASFSLEEGHPAEYAGDRRPPHTLMPVLVEREGELAYALATMGGQAQPQIHAQLLLHLLGGADAAAATSAPRWAVGAQGEGDTAATLTFEADLPAPAADSLRASAFEPKVVPPSDERLGHSNVIALSTSGHDAASDPRSDGSALVIGGQHD